MLVTHSLPEYASWKFVPHHLFDETGLAGLRLAPNGPAEAVLHHEKSGERSYLYSALAATPLPPAKGASVCPACGEPLSTAACAVCSRRREFRQAYLDAERIVAAVHAGRLYALDTETTGIDEQAEVVEIGVVSQRSGVVLNTLVRPSCERIPPEAQKVHGIIDEQVAVAPRWARVAPRLASLAFEAGAVVVAWNAPFDARMLAQSSRQAGITTPMPQLLCAMQAFAILTGTRRNRASLKSAALHYELLHGEQDHRALSDAQLTLQVMLRIAQRF